MLSISRESLDGWLAPGLGLDNCCYAHCWAVDASRDVGLLKHVCAASNRDNFHADEQLNDKVKKYAVYLEAAHF